MGLMGTAAVQSLKRGSIRFAKFQCGVFILSRKTRWVLKGLCYRSVYRKNSVAPKEGLWIYRFANSVPHKILSKKGYPRMNSTDVGKFQYLLHGPGLIFVALW